MTETLLSTWDRLVRAAPDEIAAIEAATEVQVTRQQLEQRAEQCAQIWRAAGHDLAGRRVVFSLHNSIDWLATFIALLKNDAVIVPLDPSETVASQLTTAEAIDAHFILAAHGLTARVSRRQRTRGLCLLKLTSGSTGQPRALNFTHAEMIADGRQVCASMGITPTDRNLALIPFGHSYGLGNLVVPLLVQGSQIVCISAPLPHALASDVARWRPTVFPAVPALLRVLAASDLPAESFANLRTIISAGSVLSPEIAQAFFQKFGKRIHGFYGSSETGGIAYDRTGEATLSGRSVGSPLKGVTLNYQKGQRFTVASAAVFTRGNRSPGVFRPADLGEPDKNGELVLLGRAGRMMKIASRRIDLGGLEQTLRKLPQVHDAFATPHPVNPDELAIVLATSLSASEARALLRGELAAWKMPRRLLVLKEFPLTPRGKTDTRALRSLLSG